LEEERRGKPRDNSSLEEEGKKGGGGKRKKKERTWCLIRTPREGKKTSWEWPMGDWQKKGEKKGGSKLKQPGDRTKRIK